MINNLHLSKKNNEYNSYYRNVITGLKSYDKYLKDKQVLRQCNSKELFRKEGK